MNACTYQSILKASHLERGLRWMVAVSLALHLALLAAVLGSPPDRSTTIYFNPAYTVDLVTSPGLAEQAAATDTGGPTGQAEPLWRGPGGLASQVKALEDRTHEPLKPETEPKPMPPARSQASPAEAGRPTQASSPEDVRFGRYYMAVFNRIQSAWILPRYHEHQNLSAIVEITVRSDGRIVNIQFEKRSGNTAFDRSVMRAIQKANPLPPLPAGVREPLLTLGIRFQ